MLECGNICSSLRHWIITLLKVLLVSGHRTSGGSTKIKSIQRQVEGPGTRAVLYFTYFCQTPAMSCSESTENIWFRLAHLSKENDASYKIIKTWATDL